MKTQRLDISFKRCRLCSGFAWAALFLCLGSLAGCSGCNTAGDVARTVAPGATSSHVTGKPEGSARVTYRPEVAALEEQDAVQALRGVSSNGMAFVFDSGNSKIAGLKQGDVLLVKNRMARKVLAVDRQGNETIILTRLAGLPEVVGEGKISLHQPLHFSNSMAQSRPAPLPWSTGFLGALSPQVYAQSQAQQDDASIDAGIASGKKGLNTTIKAFHTLVDDWDTDFDASPENGKLHLTLKLTRNLETVVSEIDGDGYLQDFDTMLDTAVNGGSVSQMAGAFKNINGSMDLKWSIGQKKAGANGGPVRIDFPSIVNVSLAPLLDGLPINLGVSGAMIVNPVTTGGGEFASGAYHLTYDGYQNFKMQKNAIDADGPMNLDFNPGDARAITLAPTAMVVALAAPKVQFNFGGPALDVFHVKGLQEASDTVDKWADKVAQKYLSPDAYAVWKDSTELINKAITAVANTGALVYLQILTTSTSMNGGSATMFPCRRETWDFMATVGASAQALGVPAGSLSKRIGEKKIERVSPPGGGLCKVAE
jgi:hypothetical protein